MVGTQQEAGSSGQRGPRRFARPVSDERSALGGGDDQNEWKTVGPSGDQHRGGRTFRLNPDGSVDKRLSQNQEPKQNRRRRKAQITCSYCKETFSEGDQGEHMKYLHAGAPYINWPSTLGDLVNWQCPKLGKDAETKFLNTSFDDYKALRVLFKEVRDAIDYDKRDYFDNMVNLLEENLKVELAKERRLMFKRKRHTELIDVTKELVSQPRQSHYQGYPKNDYTRRDFYQNHQVGTIPVEPTSVDPIPVGPIPVLPQVKTPELEPMAKPGHWEYWKKPNYQKNISTRKHVSDKHRKKNKKQFKEDDFAYVLSNGLGFVNDEDESDHDSDDIQKNSMVDFYALALLGNRAGRIGLYQVKTIVNPILPYTREGQSSTEHILEMKTMKGLLSRIPKLAVARAETRSSENRSHVKKGKITKFNFTDRWAIVYGTSRLTLNYSIVFVLDSKTLEFLKNKSVSNRLNEKVAESLIAWSYYDPSLVVSSMTSAEREAADITEEQDQEQDQDQDEGFTFTTMDSDDTDKIESEIKKKVDIVKAKELEDLKNVKEEVILPPASWVTGPKISNRNKVMEDEDFFLGNNDVEFDQEAELEAELEDELESDDEEESTPESRKPIVSKWFREDESDSESESSDEDELESEEDDQEKVVVSKWVRTEPISPAEVASKARRIARLNRKKVQQSGGVSISNRLTEKDVSWFDEL